MAHLSSNTLIRVNYGIVNAYLLKSSDKNYAIIDCGMPGAETRTLKAMSDLGIGKERLRYILVTHGHDDHLGACAALRKETGAKTIIHKKDADVIRTGKTLGLNPTNMTGRLFGCFVGGNSKIKGFQPYEPEIVISGDTPLYDYGIEGRIIETPGHTHGSISVLLDDGSLIVGDLIMGGFFGKGKPGYPMFADDLNFVKANVKKIIDLSPKIIYTGHGGPFTVDEVKRSFL